MGRPPKPFSVISTEGKSHRTKAELEQRKKAEDALLTGLILKERREVKSSEKAHEEFVKVNKALKKIGKNDALFEGVINRYCILKAECEAFMEKREMFDQRARKLEQERDELIADGNMTYKEYYKTLASLQNQIISIDRQIQTKRRMMLDIEKECLMTIQSGLRSIPKNGNSAKEDPLIEALHG